MGIKILKANVLDCKKIAKLHAKALPDSFLSSLGEKFLMFFYGSLSRYKKGFILVAKKNNEILGFVSAVTNLKSFYRYFIKRNFIILMPLITRKLFFYGTLRSLVEDSIYSNNETKNGLPEAEWLTFAVEEQYRGKGIAKKLFESLIKEFYGIGIREFKWFVGSQQKRAIEFYYKMNCTHMGTQELHKGKKSEIFIFKN